MADQTLSSADKVRKLVAAIRTELADPTPVAGVPTRKLSYSVAIQTTYLVALANVVNLGEHGDPGVLLTASKGESDPAVRDILTIAIGHASLHKADARQAAAFPRIIELVRTNQESTAPFPYAQAVAALSQAALYPDLESQVVPLLLTLVRSTNETPSGVPDDLSNTVGRFAKDALHAWGYSVVRDSAGVLQAVPKPVAAKPGLPVQAAQEARQ